MIKLKNRRQPGPNGFMYHEKRTGWKSWEVDATSQWDFALLCQRYREHALANPGLAMPTDMKTIEDMMDLANALRYAQIAGADIYVMRTGESAPKVSAPQAQGGLFRNVAASAKNLAAGKRTLSDWFGEGGKPVPQAEADARASICAMCPQNDDGGLLAKFTVEAARNIKEDIEELNNQKLITPDDDRLADHVCRACDCPLRLKVWTPLAHILRHMPEDTKAKLDPICWILQ